MIAATFLCLVASVHDADTLRCADGTKLRVAAVNAREVDGSCIRRAPCPVMRHAQAKPLVERLVLGRTLRCRRVGVSYARVVADCRLPGGEDLPCAIVRTGAAAWWSAYALRYRMRTCPT